MISIIVGSNRQDSKSSLIARKISQHLDTLGQDRQLLDLRELPAEILHPAMYTPAGQHPVIAQYQDKYISGGDKFIFVVPEYNGSFPGVLKLFIDAVSVRNYTSNFTAKKAFLVGVAAGRLGNAVGLNHLASVLNYVGASTFPQRLYIPAVNNKVEKGEFNHSADLDVLYQMLSEFVDY